MRQREYKNDQLLQEVKETSHQEDSVENGASGTDSCDSEFHCPVVAPDSILDRDRIDSLDWDRIDSISVSKRGVIIRLRDKDETTI